MTATLLPGAGTSAVGIDVGGTKIAAGVVGADGVIRHRLRTETPGDAAATTRALLDVVRSLAAREDIGAVGIGVPGFVDRVAGEVLVAPNLAWPHEDVAALLHAETGLAAVLENDATAAAWGEYRFGAARGGGEVLMITVGTGIGGGLVVDGVPYRGARGMAGEIGHLRVVPDGLPCGCGSRGCWEVYASGSALARRAREEGLVGAGDPHPGRTVGAAVAAGDALALALVAELGDWLGQGLASLVNVLDPGLVLVGGGVADVGDVLLDPLRSSLSAHLSGGTRAAPAVVRAELGNDAGLVGVADLARR